MKYINLPDETQHRLCFYLAMEEYVAQRFVDDDDCFFMWQVEPTVIFGRHQVIENEVISIIVKRMAYNSIAARAEEDACMPTAIM